MKHGDDKTYRDRPAGQPDYTPQSYERPAPGGFIEKSPIRRRALRALARWRGTTSDEGGDVRR